MKLYGVYNPRGKLVDVTMDPWSAWVFVFDSQTAEFRRKYWKLVYPARRAARREGWKVVRGKFVAAARQKVMEI